MTKRNKLPAITCPHCGARAVVRSSEQETPLSRELRLRCDDDDCGHQFVAQIAIIRSVAPSRKPNPEIKLPFGNQNLRWLRKKPANDDVPIPTPANDDRDAVAGVDLIRSG